MELNLASPAFENGGVIPAKFTCDGENISPELRIEGAPESTKSLALLMDDPDVPKVVREEGVFDHWVLFNIAPDTAVIGEGESPGILGSNTRGDASYTGPCPPPQYEPREHRYFFSLYALDAVLALERGASKDVVKVAMKGHILAKAELMGRFSRV